MSRIVNDPQHQIAVYRQICRILEDEITHNYQRGEWLPSEGQII